MKKKVCILQNGLARGGTDTFVVNLCRNINKDKFEVTVVNPSNKPDSLAREEEVKATGAKIVHTHPLNSLSGKIKHLKMLYAVLRKGRFDVFQTNIDLFNGPNLFVAWLAGVPIRCCHSHNSMQQKALVEGATLPIRIYQRMMRWMCWHFANRRCGCSDMANDFLYAGHDWESQPYPTIINNPVDIERFRCRIDVNAKKQRLCLTACKHIITVGRFIPQKNPLFLVEILRELFSKREGIDMLWVGAGGKYEDEVKTKVKYYGIEERVHFLGTRSDVNELMHVADLFLLPSKFEGLAIVLIEAQAAGLPCLASSTTPLHSSCGGVSYLDLDKDPSIWADAIIDIIDGRTVLKISDEALAKFSSLNTARQMEKVFRQ